MKVEYRGTIHKVLAIDFDGIIIRKGEPSVIIKENDGCISLSECKLIYPQRSDNSSSCGNHFVTSHNCNTLCEIKLFRRNYDSRIRLQKVSPLRWITPGLHMRAGRDGSGTHNTRTRKPWVWIFCTVSSWQY